MDCTDVPKTDKQNIDLTFRGCCLCSCHFGLFSQTEGSVPVYVVVIEMYGG